MIDVVTQGLYDGGGYLVIGLFILALDIFTDSERDHA